MTVFPADFSWWQLVIALISVAGTVLASVKSVQAFLRKRASSKWDQSYTDIRDIYQAIQNLLAETPASRVMVMKSENGGGIPTPDGVVTNSVTYEVNDPGVDPVQKFWTDVRLDAVYSDIIMAVSTKGVSDISASELSSGDLYDFFEACECANARLVRICATRSALLYLCVCLGKDATLEASDRLRIGATARELCGIFANHHELIKKEARD